ncbi:unnamed protein product [Caenorhabditis brenneri]
MPSHPNFSIPDMVLTFYNFTFPLMIFGVAVGGIFLKFLFPTPMLAISVILFWRASYNIMYSIHDTLVRCNRNLPDLVICRDSLVYGWIFVIICALISRIVVYICPESYDALYLTFYVSTRLIFFTHQLFVGNEKEYCRVIYDWNDPIPSGTLLVYIWVYLKYFPRDTPWTVAFFQWYYTGIAAAATVECLQVLRGNIRLVKWRREQL